MTNEPSAPDARANSEEIEAIKTGIASFIESELERREPLLLSALGISMRGPLNRLKKLTGRTVGSIVEQDFSSRFQIARLGPHKNIIALYKLGHEISLPAASSSVREGSARVLYTRELWLAFAVPISAAYRYIDLKALKFFDTDDGAIPDGHLMIEREYLRDATESHDPKEIAQRIGKWCADKGIDPTLYLLKEKSLPTHQAQGRSVLELMLSSLDRRQLQSVSLPLDVIDALLRNRT